MIILNISRNTNDQSPFLNVPWIYTKHSRDLEIDLKKRYSYQNSREGRIVLTR